MGQTASFVLSIMHPGRRPWARLEERKRHHEKRFEQGLAQAVSCAVFAAALAAGAMISPAASAADAQACEGNNAVFELNSGFPPSDWS